MKQIHKNPKIQKAIFVTGGSGFLGAHFIWRLLTTTDFHIIANMRPLSPSEDFTDLDAKDGRIGAKEVEVLTEAKSRLLKVLQKSAYAYGLAHDRVMIMKTLAEAPKRITVMLNNLSAQSSISDVSTSQDMAKSDSSDRDDLLRSFVIEDCWHFAGYLTPEKKLTEYDDFANVTMTQNALRLADSLQVSSFFHVSTAYVSGRVAGVVKEELFDFTAPEPDFRNSYERSKYLAEKEACAYVNESSLSQQAGFSLTIFRPSIVIGPRVTKDNGSSQSGFYGVLKAFWRLRGRKLKEQIRIPVACDAGLDLIPVDDFLEEVWRIREEQVKEDVRQKRVEVHHLVAGRCVAPDLVILMAATHYNSPITPQIISDDQDEDIGISAKVLASQLDFYSDYVGSALNFERKRQAPPSLTDRDVLNYITSIGRVYQYGSVEDIFTVSVVEGYNGIDLPVFDTGMIEPAQNGQSSNKSGKTILFCHAMAMGAELLIPLAYHLKKAGHRLITWETRILPSLTPHFEEDGSSLDVHAQDGLSIIRQIDLAESTLLIAGWSTGAGVACKLANMILEKEEGARALGRSVGLERLLLLNGSFMLEGAALTPFQKNMNVVMPQVAKNRDMTKKLFSMVFAPPHSLKWWNVSSKVFRHQANKIMGVNDPRLEHITRQPVRNSETAYRYANQIAGYLSTQRWDWLENIAVPTWVMTCKDDSMTDPSGSYAVHKLIRKSTLKVYETGDHFKLYQDQVFFDDILEVINSDDA